MTFYAVINDAGEITMISTPGRPHIALWKTIDDAYRHLRNMESLNRHTYQIVQVHLEVLPLEGAG